MTLRIEDLTNLEVVEEDGVLAGILLVVEVIQETAPLPIRSEKFESFEKTESMAGKSSPSLLNYFKSTSIQMTHIEMLRRYCKVLFYLK